MFQGNKAVLSGEIAIQLPRQSRTDVQVEVLGQTVNVLAVPAVPVTTVPRFSGVVAVNEIEGAAAWLTIIGLPSIVRCAVRAAPVFFENEKLTGFIDFYFACTDWLAYDLAICLNAWCFEPDGSFVPVRGHALLQSYQKVRKLTDAELTALPILARGAALRFLLTRLYDWINHPPGAMVKKKDPLEYRRKLAFHRQCKTASAYGI